jgi:hypothetical protein
LNFTPLEMSFTRRPNGILNWFKDIFSGKPYRLLSDMRDGHLYSPDGGSLKGVFPWTISAILNDPLALSVLKSARNEKLAGLVSEYQQLGDLESQTHTRLLDLLRSGGAKNALMFYMQGFRDSQIHVADEMIREVIDSCGLPSVYRVNLSDAVYGNQTGFELNVPRRGYMGIGRWGPELGFLDASYALPSLKDDLDKEGNGAIYDSIPQVAQRRLPRLLRIREELVQEAGMTIEPVEYCRSAFYRLSKELGRRLVGANIIDKAGDINFLTVREVAKALRRKQADRDAISRRKDTFSDLHNP